eukprot:m.87407 g.87407  ORF g.87407 m.87407 type:complete len:56 (+) comp13107_c0_seq1:1023-1190(+)
MNQKKHMQGTHKYSTCDIGCLSAGELPPSSSENERSPSANNKASCNGRQQVFNFC